jgi:hypothetical protein
VELIFFILLVDRSFIFPTLFASYSKVLNLKDIILNFSLEEGGVIDISAIILQFIFENRE